MKKITWENGKTKLNKSTMDEFQNNISDEFDNKETKITDLTTKVNDIININDYSIEKKKVGKWVDGKDQYEKIVISTTPNATTNGVYVQKFIDIEDNIDVCYIVTMFVIDEEEQNHPVPYINNSGYILKAFIEESKKRINLLSNSTAYNNAQVYAIVRYTLK